MFTAIKSLAALTAIAATGLAATPAYAQFGRPNVSAEFAYNPSDSAESNYRAVVRTAKRACSVPGVKSLAMTIKRNACTAELVDLAVAAIGRSDLASLHYGETGRSGADRQLASTGQ